MLINKDPNESNLHFLFRLRKLLRGFDPLQTVIEVPEALGWANVVPHHFFVHVRLHCALTIARRFDGQKQKGWLEFRERRGLVQGQYLSSPSLLMVDETRRQFEIDKKIHVYPHLPPCEAWTGRTERDIDVLVLGRAQYLKGFDNLDSLISALPRSMKVVVAGAGFSDFRFSRQDILVLGERSDSEKMDLFRRSKCLALLSRFESFSLVAAEAILNGAQVVCWDKIGLSEWVSHLSAMTTVQIEGARNMPSSEMINQFAESLVRVARAGMPIASEEVYSVLVDSFHSGFNFLLTHLSERT